MLWQLVHSVICTLLLIFGVALSLSLSLSLNRSPLFLQPFVNTRMYRCTYVVEYSILHVNIFVFFIHFFCSLCHTIIYSCTYVCLYACIFMLFKLCIGVYECFDLIFDTTKTSHIKKKINKESNKYKNNNNDNMKKRKNTKSAVT